MFVLNSENALALAMIILVDVQGATQVKRQLPLQAIDEGSNWLIKGGFYDDPSLNVHFCVSHIFIAKQSAEVVGIGSDIRTKLDAANEERFRKR